MNLEFNYMYRDGANYKQFGSVVFANPTNLTLEVVVLQIRESLIDGEFFDPSKLSIPNVRVYPYDPEIDHDWFEFENVEQTDKATTDKRTIEEFIAEFKGELHLD